MASYYSNVAASATIFTGFTTSVGSATDGSTSVTMGATGITSVKWTSAGVATGTAPLAAPLKMPMKTGTAPTVTSLKMKLTSIGSGTAWYHGVSWARTLAYTTSMKVSGGTFVCNVKRLSSVKFFAEAFNSAGVRQGSTLLFTATNGSPGGSTQLSVAVPTTKIVTVPKSGYLVVRADILGTTTRTKGTFQNGNGSGKGLGLVWNPTETIAVTNVTILGVAGALTYTGQVGIPVVAPVPRTATATLHDSTGTAIPNGVRVHAFLASDYSGAADITSLGSALTTGGTGAVSVTVATPNNVVLVADMLSASVPAGEVVMTDEITPVI